MSNPQDVLQLSKKQAGFTLIEVLVALVLLSTALVPPFVLAGNAIRLADRIKNSVIAAQLAQEGVEVVRAIRDANWYSGQAFSSGLTTCAAECTVQYNSTSTSSAYNGSPLKVDTSTGLYQYQTGNSSGFQRKMVITSVSTTQLRVQSIVTWTDRGSNVSRTLTVEYVLFNWL